LASQATANAYIGTSARALLQEQQSMDRTLAEAGQVRQLADRPLIVLTAAGRESAQELRALGWTAEQAQNFFDTLRALHDDETSWSSRGRHEVVPGASHYLQFDRPEQVIAAVREVITDVRQLQPPNALPQY